MKISKHISLLLLIGFIVLWGCRDIYELEKYQRPDWLAGKIYTQISTQPELSNFTTCLQLTGYDSILDITGYYTVFAPTNEAF
ncbi:MAG: fasciclin domain-containing protein, partial [Bacteroides sp.]|nr:fasciclin domain-containing protein [Bacteroides sp.]